MRIVITGSSGHLGEGLMRRAGAAGHAAVGLDLRPGAHTNVVAAIMDREAVRAAMEGADAVIHAATLHKPHVATHSKQDFVDANISGTLVLLEEAAAAGASRFVFASTTSAFGDALAPGPGEPAAWIDETVQGGPKNIYGATKTAAETLCALFARNEGMTVSILRTSRFFSEADDNPETRAAYADENAKANEFLHRRVDVEDIVDAHFLAVEIDAPGTCERFIISATTPFLRSDLADLRVDPAAVVAKYYPGFPEIYDRRSYSMFPDIGRVYDNAKARVQLGWRPGWDFERVLEQLGEGAPISSELAREIGSKRYHAEVFEDGPYPVD